jgi:hypothetical protein
MFSPLSVADCGFEGWFGQMMGYWRMWWKGHIAEQLGLGWSQGTGGSRGAHREAATCGHLRRLLFASELAKEESSASRTTSAAMTALRMLASAMWVEGR